MRLPVPGHGKGPWGWIAGAFNRIVRLSEIWGEGANGGGGSGRGVDGLTGPACLLCERRKPPTGLVQMFLLCAPTAPAAGDRGFGAF